MNKLFSVLLFCLINLIVLINGQESSTTTTTEFDIDCTIKELNLVTGEVTYNDLNDCFMVNATCLWIDYTSEMCGSCFSTDLVLGGTDCSTVDGTAFVIEDVSGTIRCEQSTATITTACDLQVLFDNSTSTDSKSNIKYNIYYTFIIFNIIISLYQILL